MTSRRTLLLVFLWSVWALLITVMASRVSFGADLLEYVEDSGKCRASARADTNLDQTPNPNDWDSYVDFPLVASGEFSARSEVDTGRSSGGGAQAFQCVGGAGCLLSPNEYKVTSGTIMANEDYVGPGWHSEVKTSPRNCSAQMNVINETGEVVSWLGHIRLQILTQDKDSLVNWSQQVTLGHQGQGLSTVGITLEKNQATGAWEWAWYGTRYYFNANGDLVPENMTLRPNLPLQCDVTVPVGGYVNDGSSVLMWSQTNPTSLGYAQNKHDGAGDGHHNAITLAEGVVYDDN